MNFAEISELSDIGKETCGMIPVLFKFICIISALPSLTAIPVNPVALVSPTIVVRTWIIRELSFVPEMKIAYMHVHSYVDETRHINSPRQLNT